MTAEIILIAVLGFPLLLGLLARVNTSYLFFSLLSGEILARYFGYDVELAFRMASGKESISQYGELAVLVLPMVLTAVFLRKSLTRGRLLLHIVPLAVMGVVFAAFVLPVIPEHLIESVKSSKYGSELVDNSNAIVGVVVLIQLVTLWLTGRSESSGKKKH